METMMMQAMTAQARLKIFLFFGLNIIDKGYYNFKRDLKQM